MKVTVYYALLDIYLKLPQSCSIVYIGLSNLSL